MAKLSDIEVKTVLQAHLLPGEQLQAWAVAYSIPGRWIYLSGGLLMLLFQQWYAAGLTDQRFILLRYKGRLKVQEVMEYDLTQVPAVDIAQGPFHTRIIFKDPRKQLFLKFHRMTMPSNRQNAMRIADTLRQMAGGAGAPPPKAGPALRESTLVELASPVLTSPSPEPLQSSAQPIVAVQNSSQGATLPEAESFPPSQSMAHPEGRGIRDTVYRDPSSPPPRPGREIVDTNNSPRAVRKIVGFLISYTWKSEGQLFPIREGRNLIGRDEEQCDIAVPEDESLSAVNSHITFRRNFVIGDMMSMVGTYIDGESVQEQFHPLKNYAKICTGSTHWTFVATDPALTGDFKTRKPVPQVP